MSKSPISEVARVKPLTARRWLMVCLAVSVLVPSIGHAQLTGPASATRLMAIESGLHWLGPEFVRIDHRLGWLGVHSVRRACGSSSGTPPAGSLPAPRHRSDPGRPRSCGFRTRTA